MPQGRKGIRGKVGPSGPHPQSLRGNDGGRIVATRQIIKGHG